MPECSVATSSAAPQSPIPISPQLPNLQWRNTLKTLKRQIKPMDAGVLPWKRLLSLPPQKEVSSRPPRGQPPPNPLSPPSQSNEASTQSEGSQSFSTAPAITPSSPSRQLMPSLPRLPCEAHCVSQPFPQPHPPCLSFHLHEMLPPDRRQDPPRPCGCRREDPQAIVAPAIVAPRQGVKELEHQRLVDDHPMGHKRRPVWRGRHPVIIRGINTP